MRASSRFALVLKPFVTMAVAVWIAGLLSCQVGAATESDRSRAGLLGPVMSVEETEGSPEGRPSSVVTYSQEGRIVNEVTYANGRVTAENYAVWDTQGRVLREANLRYGLGGEALDASWRDIEYSYDAADGGTVASEYGRDGRLRGTIRTASAYQNGRKVLEETTSTTRDGAVTFRKCIYEYNAKGELVKELWYNREGVLLSKIAHNYDSRGSLVAMSTLAPGGQVLARQSWKYNSAGRPIELVSNGPAGDERTSYRYGASGELVGTSRFRAGALVENTSVDPKLGVTYITLYLKGYTLVSVVGKTGFTERRVKRRADGTVERENRFIYELDSRKNWVRMVTLTAASASSGASETTLRRNIVYYPDGAEGRAPYYEATGRISDESGKGIGGVSLAFTSGLAGVSRQTVTDEAGNWFAAGLSGPSIVSARKEGWFLQPGSIQVSREKPLAHFVGSFGMPPPLPPGHDLGGGSEVELAAPPMAPLESVGAPPSLSPVTAATAPASLPPATVSTVAELPQASGGGGFAVRPTLGYSALRFGPTGGDSGQGPTGGVEATYGVGRMQVKLAWDGMRSSALGSDWIGVGIGYALLPRPDARLGLSAGVGHYTAWGDALSVGTSGFQGFAEMELRVSPGTKNGEGLAVESSLGVRLGSGRWAQPASSEANPWAAYLRLGFTHAGALSYGVLAMAVALLTLLR